MIASPVRDIHYGAAAITDFNATYNAKGEVESLTVDGRTAKPSQRFWTSLCSTYSSHGLSPKLFKLYSHAEVFSRLQERLGDMKTTLRWALEELENGSCTMLAVSGTGKARIDYAPAYELLLANSLENSLSYGKGVITTEHRPPNMDDFTIGNEQFSYRYVTETPIDGFGKPLIYLSILRQVCTNGAIGYAKAFRSEVNPGNANDSPLLVLERALDAFNNEEGYAALRQRFESAAGSWASVGETYKVWKTVKSLMDRKALVMPKKRDKSDLTSLAYRRTVARKLAEATEVNDIVNRAFLQLSGDIVDLYKLTDIEALTEKKQRTIPAKCTMYDLLNFTTEIATHYTADDYSAKALQGLVGTLVSNEYDLEGTVKTKPKFTDWFTDISGSEKFEQN